MNLTLDVSADQLRRLLVYARRSGSVDAWATLAMHWIELASEYIEDTRERDKEE